MYTEVNDDGTWESQEYTEHQNDIQQLLCNDKEPYMSLLIISSFPLCKSNPLQRYCEYKKQ